MVNVSTIRKSLGTLGPAYLGNAARWARVKGPAHSKLIYLYGHEHQPDRSDALASLLMVLTLATVQEHTAVLCKHTRLCRAGNGPKTVGHMPLVFSYQGTR